MGDLISRQAVIKLIREMADDFTKKNTIDMVDPRELAFKVWHLPSAEPERKKPDHGYMWICPECGLEVHSDFRRCVRCGWDRPSAEPEWKKGRWCKAYADIELHGIRPFIRVCSSCASVSNDYYNYCPNCGARMEE